MSPSLACRLQLPSSIGPSFALRQQNDGDTTFVRELFVTRRWAEFSAVQGWNDAQRRLFLQSQAELQRLHYETRYPTAEFFIIEQASQEIGRLCLLEETNHVRIVDIALLPSWQGLGIGSRLLEEILARADQQHKCCTLSVEQGSRASALYRRLGFKPRHDSGVYLHMQRPVGGNPQEDLDNP